MIEKDCIMTPVRGDILLRRRTAHLLVSSLLGLCLVLQVVTTLPYHCRAWSHCAGSRSRQRRRIYGVGVPRPSCLVRGDRDNSGILEENDGGCSCWGLRCLSSSGARAINTRLWQSAAAENVGTYQGSRQQQQRATTDKASSNTEAEADAEPPKEKEQTLYDILRASPTATKRELKKHYVEMARLSHPDAVMGKRAALSSEDYRGDGDQHTAAIVGPIPEFSEVAEAWRILSDPLQRKRYDRTLLAESFKQDVERAAAEVTKTAGPHVLKLIENFAIPMLRRSAVTTAAAIEAVADNLSSQNINGTGGVGASGDNVVDIGQAVGAAFMAGQNAGKTMDRMELQEKSEELDKRATTELEQAAAMRAEASAIAEQRISLSLNTPDASLTASEAMILFMKFNATMPEMCPTRLESLLKKHTIDSRIHMLEEAEHEYEECMTEMNKVETEYTAVRAAASSAEANLAAAEQAEMEARAAYERAQALVAECKDELWISSRHFNHAESERKWTFSEAERVTHRMRQRQEQVRIALKRKKEDIELERERSSAPASAADKDDDVGQPAIDLEKDSNANGAEMDDFLIVGKEEEEDDVTPLELLKKLKMKESMYLSECARKEDLASRMKTQAAKLREATRSRRKANA